MIGMGAIVRRFIIICSLAMIPFVVLWPRTCSLGHQSLHDAAFGIDAMLDDGSQVFFETSTIPLVPGTSFGCRLTLAEPDRPMLLREEFILPAPPAYWGVSSDTMLSDDRQVAITERIVTPENGRLESRWVVTPGDPAGRYRLRVFLDDALVGNFFVTAE